MLTLERPTPTAKRWTRDDFVRLGDLGFFEPDDRVELVDGEIIDMGSQGPPHFRATDRAMRVLMRVFEPSCWVRNQGPLYLSVISQPVPDVAVVSGSVDDYQDDHPSAALLIVEVSDTSVGFDRGRKARLYAGAGIAEYWIIDVNARQLEIRRTPTADGYAEVTVFSETDTVTPIAAPDALIAVKDLLP